MPLFEGRVATVAAELVDDSVVRDAHEPTFELGRRFVEPAFDGAQAGLLHGGFDEPELVDAEASYQRRGHAAERRAKLPLELPAPRRCARHFQDAAPARRAEPRRARFADRGPDI